MLDFFGLCMLAYPFTVQYQIRLLLTLWIFLHSFLIDCATLPHFVYSKNVRLKTTVLQAGQ